MNLFPQSNTAAGRLTAAGIGAVGSFILFAAYMVVPPAGLLSGLLAPFPALFSRYRYGRPVAIIITLGAAGLLGIVFGIQASGLYLVQCAVIAHLVLDLLSRGFGTARSLLWTTAVNMAVYCSVAVAFTLVTGTNIHGLAVQEINNSLSQAAALYERSGVKGEDLAAVKQSMNAAAGLIVKIYPALMTVMLTAMTGFNLALLRRAGAKLGQDPQVSRFNDFRMPEPVIWVLIAAGFAMLVPEPVFSTPALNIIVVLAFFYFLQGMAVIFTIISRMAFTGFLRIALYMMLVFQPYMAALVAILGIFDLWGDFRTPRKQENL